MVEASHSQGEARRLRLGMVGGGVGAFIGEVHRVAARIDDRFELVAGAFSSTPERCRQSAQTLGIRPERSYGSFHEMCEKEAHRADRIDAVAIVAPNHVHVPASSEFLRAQIPVICDKPLSHNIDDARTLVNTVRATGGLFGLTHNYTGYPLIRQARELVRAGGLGPLRVVQVEYAQDWLSTPLESSGQKQADWRTDPSRGGAGGLLGDIGTHAFQLVEFVTGLTLQAVAAEMTAFVPGRRVPDNGQVLLRYAEGARGALWCSQVATGRENALRMRLFGEHGSLEWNQEDPNRMVVSRLGKSDEIWTRGSGYLGATARRATRLPTGHPEGYLEAFATLYRDMAEQVLARQAKRAPNPESLLLPTVEDGLRAMQFVDACLASHRGGASWVALDSV